MLVGEIVRSFSTTAGDRLSTMFSTDSEERFFISNEDIFSSISELVAVVVIPDVSLLSFSLLAFIFSQLLFTVPCCTSL